MASVISELMTRERAYTIPAPAVSGETDKKKTTLVSTTTGAPQGPSSFLGVGDEILNTLRQKGTHSVVVADPYTVAVTGGWATPVGGCKSAVPASPLDILRSYPERISNGLAKGASAEYASSCECI